MKNWKDTILVPPLDIYNMALMINTSNFNISLVNTTFTYSLIQAPLGSSNIYYDDLSNEYFFVTVDRDLRGVLYQGKGKNFNNIYNFTDNTPIW